MVSILSEEEQKSVEKPKHRGIYKLNITSNPIGTADFQSSQGDYDKSSIANAEALAHVGNDAISMSHAKSKQAAIGGVATGSTHSVGTYLPEERELYLNSLDEFGKWKTEKIAAQDWLYKLFELFGRLPKV